MYVSPLVFPRSILTQYRQERDHIRQVQPRQHQRTQDLPTPSQHKRHHNHLTPTKSLTPSSTPSTPSPAQPPSPTTITIHRPPPPPTTHLPPPALLPPRRLQPSLPIPRTDAGALQPRRRPRLASPEMDPPGTASLRVPQPRARGPTTRRRRRRGCAARPTETRKPAWQ